MAYFTRTGIIPFSKLYPGKLKETVKVAGSGWLKPNLTVLPTHDPVTGWTNKSRRTGVIATKIGMMSATDEWGQIRPCTVLRVNDCFVTQQKTQDKHGYTAIQVGGGRKKAKRLSNSMKGQLAAADVPPVRELHEFRVTKDALVPVGLQLHAAHFQVGQKVDVTAISKGKGFQGAMKRWGFGGLPASHGVSLTHRSLGATGQRQDPGKVFKGKKMHGRMGGKQRTTLGLKVLQIDKVMNCVLVVGGVPGGSNGIVRVRDAANYKFATPPAFPTYHPEQDKGVEGSVFESTVRAANSKKPIAIELDDSEIKDNNEMLGNIFPLKLSPAMTEKIEAIKVKYRKELLYGNVGDIIKQEFPEWLPTSEEKALFDRAKIIHKQQMRDKRAERQAKFPQEKRKTHLLDTSIKKATEPLNATPAQASKSQSTKTGAQQKQSQQSQQKKQKKSKKAKK